MTTPACPSYAGYRFPVEIISHAVWLYFRFPLSLRMVDELLAARGIIVSYETVCHWAELTEGSAGVASGMVNEGTDVRPGVCRPDPAQATCRRCRSTDGAFRTPQAFARVPRLPRPTCLGNSSSECSTVSSLLVSDVGDMTATPGGTASPGSRSRLDRSPSSVISAPGRCGCADATWPALDILAAIWSSRSLIPRISVRSSTNISPSVVIASSVRLAGSSQLASIFASAVGCRSTKSAGASQACCRGACSPDTSDTGAMCASACSAATLRVRSARDLAGVATAS